MSRRTSAVIAVVFLGFVAYLMFSTFSLGRITCEVCVEYQGRRACRTASAESREEAVRTATDNACAQLVSGMTQIMACTQTPPTSVRCE